MSTQPTRRTVWLAARVAAWIAAGLALGLILAQYASGGMLLAFLQRLPGCL